MRDQSGDAIIQFLERLGTSLTASFAPNQLDPWYGNLVVEFDWSAVRLERPLSEQGGLNPSISTRGTDVSGEVLTPEKFGALKRTDLTSIFVDGMRAGQVKANFANWFIPIERLESHAFSRFKNLFTRLYSEEDISEVAARSKLSDEPLKRLGGFLSEPTRTVETRAKKLYTIIENIGLSNFTFGGDNTRFWTVSLTEDICRRLIKSRNTLAHAGTEVDEDMLYKTLFPLSYRLVIYLNDEDSAGSLDSRVASI